MDETNTVRAPDGFDIVYGCAGVGPALLLLPGLMTNRQRWRDAGYVDHFAQGRRVIALDPLGHGDSDKPHDPNAYALERLAEHSAAVLDAEDVGVADVWGYSRGCLLLAAMMQHRAERVRTAIAGGIDLTALAPAPDDQAVEGRRPSSFLREGDWAGFRRTLAFEIPDVRFEQARRENDPLAIAALMDVEITLAFY
jgi:pimeloyl-ACP methyl ester carboxylesterase